MCEFYNDITSWVFNYMEFCHLVLICYQKVTREWEEKEVKLERKKIVCEIVCDAVANLSSRTGLTEWVEHQLSKMLHASHISRNRCSISFPLILFFPLYLEQNCSSWSNIFPIIFIFAMKINSIELRNSSRTVTLMEKKSQIYQVKFNPSLVYIPLLTIAMFSGS